MVEAKGGRYSEADPTLKRLDAWWTVLLVDPFAVRLVRLLAPRQWITATALTVVAHLMGLVSAVLFATDQLLAAAIVFEVRFVLDCADGKLARARGTSSSAGGYLDYVGDYLVAGANFVALGLWLSWYTDTTAVISVGLPASFLASVAVGRSVDLLGPMRLVSEAMPGGYRAWMAAHRLRPVPSRIDVEHVLLFALPIAAVAVDRSWPVAVGAGVATTYFIYSTLRIFAAGLHIAREKDLEVRN